MTFEVMKDHCAVNEYALFRQFMQKMMQVNLKRAFIPVRNRIICLNHCLTPVARILDRKHWTVTDFPSHVNVTAPLSRSTFSVSIICQQKEKVTKKGKDAVGSLELMTPCIQGTNASIELNKWLLYSSAFQQINSSCNHLE